MYVLLDVCYVDVCSFELLFFWMYVLLMTVLLDVCSFGCRSMFVWITIRSFVQRKHNSGNEKDTHTHIRSATMSYTISYN